MVGLEPQGGLEEGEMTTGTVKCKIVILVGKVGAVQFNFIEVGLLLVDNCGE